MIVKLNSMKMIWPVFLFVLSSSFSQTKSYNFYAVDKIDSLLSVDRKWKKNEFNFSKSYLSDTLRRKYLKQDWIRTDSLDLIDVKFIIDKYGYKGENYIICVG